MIAIRKDLLLGLCWERKHSLTFCLVNQPNNTWTQLMTSDDKPVILGQELANAAKAEKIRLDSGEFLKSPLPEKQYDFWRGDLDLINPSINKLDDLIRLVCVRYSSADKDIRSTMRSSISMDQFYTLLRFARRSSVFGMQQSNSDLIADGLTAITMIEINRVDYRDILMNLALLYHALNKTGADSDAVFVRKAEIAEQKIAELLIGFVEQSPEYRDLRKSWGYAEVYTDVGPGFMEWGLKKYETNANLKNIILAISNITELDYKRDSIELATEIPEVWLGTQRNPTIKNALSSVKGCARLSASLRPHKFTDHASQRLMVFLSEVEDEQQALGLHQLVEQKASVSHSKVAIAENNLFCLVIANSFMLGKELFETDSSLMRFFNDISLILKQCRN